MTNLPQHPTHWAHLPFISTHRIDNDDGRDSSNTSTSSTPSYEPPPIGNLLLQVSPPTMMVKEQTMTKNWQSHSKILAYEAERTATGASRRQQQKAHLDSAITIFQQPFNHQVNYSIFPTSALFLPQLLQYTPFCFLSPTKQCILYLRPAHSNKIENGP